MSYFIYNAILLIAFCTAVPLLPFMLVLGKRFRAGFGQRFGFYPREVRRRLAGSRPIWIHAASVGEVRAAKVLIDALQKRFPERKMILSTFTQTGNEVAQKQTAAEAVIFLPLDLVWSARRALSTLKPSVLIMIETEIWPNVLRQAYQRGIPTLLVSGRVSHRAFRSYARFGWLFRDVLRCLKGLGMQSEPDRDRIINLGADSGCVQITGNLKNAAFLDKTHSDSGDVTSRSDPRQSGIGRDGFLWVVGSSHRGEETIVLAAFELLKKKFPRLRMVLAPRHPQRFREVEKILLSHGLTFEKKSQANGNLHFEKDVMILDTLGDLERFYAVGDFAFVGGSLVDAGGHNLLEPARFRKPVLFGPYTSNFAALAHELIQKGGGIQVGGCEDLVREITALLAEPEKCKAIGGRAFQIATRDYGVVDGSVNLIARYLEARTIS